MDKQHILDEIRRTADENGGNPLGQKKFAAATGIRNSAWRGKYWVRWSEAVIEAGYEANKPNEALSDDYVLTCLAEYILELGAFPTYGDFKIKRRSDSSFPAYQVFLRIGNKAELAHKLVHFCRGKPELGGVIPICESIVGDELNEDVQGQNAGSDGFVYLMKSGKHYKIGFTNSMDRRRYELGPKLPLGIEPIHSIRTDDPAGIEAYWHRRFKDKHMNGEWFDLSPQDVAAFKRRKFM